MSLSPSSQVERFRPNYTFNAQDKRQAIKLLLAPRVQKPEISVLEWLPEMPLQAPFTFRFLRLLETDSSTTLRLKYKLLQLLSQDIRDLDIDVEAIATVERSEALIFSRFIARTLQIPLIGFSNGHFDHSDDWFMSQDISTVAFVEGYQTFGDTSLEAIEVLRDDFGIATPLHVSATSYGLPKVERDFQQYGTQAKALATVAELRNSSHFENKYPDKLVTFDRWYRQIMLKYA